MSHYRSSRAQNNEVFFSIIALMCTTHFINDTTQSLLPSIYPLLKDSYALSLFKIGCITAAFQIVGSVFQPVIGYFTDKHPMPYAIAIAFVSSASGIIFLSYSSSYYSLLIGSILLGLGSALFHPESSRITRYASGGRYGLAQSLFQIGGNLGTALGPLLAAVFIVKQTQLMYIIPFSIASIFGTLIAARWYRNYLAKQSQSKKNVTLTGLSKDKVVTSLVILITLMFAKYIYLSTFQNYYSLYVIQKFNLSVHGSQIMIFLFLLGIALGTIFGGALGDRIGAKKVIWFSILGVFPFTIIIPFVGLYASGVISVIIGLILASAFPAMVVYAQELVPGKVGTIGGAMYGFAYGIGALSACLMGYIGDHIGLHKLFIISGYLPLLGMLAIYLPDFHSHITIENEPNSEN